MFLEYSAEVLGIGKSGEFRHLGHRHSLPYDRGCTLQPDGANEILRRLLCERSQPAIEERSAHCHLPA